MKSLSFQFESLGAFFAMDGHGVYVWSAYGISGLILIWLAVAPVLRRKRLLVTQRSHRQEKVAR